MESFTYSLVRLFPEDAVDIINHISWLSDEDRYLRFGYTATRYTIEQYVTSSISTINTRKKADFWFGITNECDILIASLHVAIYDDVAEFAFTTSAGHRDKKLGQLLFARAYQLSTEFKISRIYLACLSKNSAMKHIAKKFGMSVMTHGVDSESSVNISYPVPLNRVHEVKMSIIDKSIFDKGKLL